MMPEPTQELLINYKKYLKEYLSRSFQKEGGEEYQKEFDRLAAKFIIARDAAINYSIERSFLRGQINIVVKKKFPFLPDEQKLQLPHQELRGILSFDEISDKQGDRTGRYHKDHFGPFYVRALLVYLEIPFEDWHRFDNGKFIERIPPSQSALDPHVAPDTSPQPKPGNDTSAQSDESRTTSTWTEAQAKLPVEVPFSLPLPKPSIIGEEYNRLLGSWNGYMYFNNFRSALVKQLPIFIEKESDTVLSIHCKDWNNNVFSGPGLIYDDTLLITLFGQGKEKERKIATLQTWVQKEALKGKLLNTALIWNQSFGKPQLSIILLEKLKDIQYDKEKLPDSVPVTFRENFTENEQQKAELLNNLIEYTARKNEPERAPRFMKLSEIEKRNEKDAHRNHRAREHFLFLKEHFVDKKGGEWLSFSRIFSHLDTDIKTASVFHWKFEADYNLRVINVLRTANRKKGRTFLGQLQLEAGHFSIYSTDKKGRGFKHFLAPAPDEGTFPTIIKGVSSTVYNKECLALRELLVYVEGYDADWEKDARIPWDVFVSLPCLTEAHLTDKNAPPIQHFRHLEEPTQSILRS